MSSVASTSQEKGLLENFANQVSAAIPRPQVRVDLGLLGEHTIISAPEGAVCGPATHYGSVSVETCHVRRTPAPDSSTHLPIDNSQSTSAPVPTWQPENATLWEDINYRCPNASEAMRRSIYATALADQQMQQNFDRLGTVPPTPPSQVPYPVEQPRYECPDENDRFRRESEQRFRDEVIDPSTGKPLSEPTPSPSPSNISPLTGDFAAPTMAAVGAAPFAAGFNSPGVMMADNSLASPVTPLTMTDATPSFTADQLDGLVARASEQVSEIETARQQAETSSSTADEYRDVAAQSATATDQLRDQAEQLAAEVDQQRETAQQASEQAEQHCDATAAHSTDAEEHQAHAESSAQTADQHASAADQSAEAASHNRGLTEEHAETADQSRQVADAHAADRGLRPAGEFCAADAELNEPTEREFWSASHMRSFVFHFSQCPPAAALARATISTCSACFVFCWMARCTTCRFCRVSSNLRAMNSLASATLFST